MRKIILILPLIACVPARSQKKIFSYADETNISYPFPRSSVILIEANNAFIYTHAEKDRLARFLWSNNSTTKLVEQRSSDASSNEGFRKYSIAADKIIKTYWKNPVIGGLYKNRQIIEVIRDKKNGDFYYLKTDLQSGVTEFTDTISSSTTERVIDCFSKLDKLYLLTAPENSDQLNIYTSEIDGPVKKNAETISFTELGIKAADITVKGNHFSDLLRPNQCALFHNNQRCPAVLTSSSNKIYSLTDKLVFVLNTDSSICTIILDLKNLSHIVKTFPRWLDPKVDVKSQKTSSFLFNDKLVSCNLTTDALLLDFFDFSTSVKFRSININRDNIDSLTAQPVQKTGSFLSKSDLKSETFDNFMKTAENNSLSISCYEESENIYISIAAPYKQVINGSTLYNILLTGAATYGINTTPNYRGFLISMDKGAQTATYVGFDISFNSSTFSPTRKTGDFSVWDNIGGFLDTHPAHGTDRLFFYMNGNFYLSDYFPYTKTYSIYSFDQNGVN